MAKWYTTQQAACAYEIMARLQTGILPGNVLDVLRGTFTKLTVLNYPDWRTVGVKDLPLLCIYDYQDTDTIFAGAKTGSGTSDQKDARGNVNIQTECILNLIVSADRTAGLTMMAPNTKPGVLDWALAIKDCIERMQDQKTPDSLLCGTCKKPLFISVRDNGAREVDWAMMIEVKYYPQPTLKGTRTDPWGVQPFPSTG